MRDYEPIGGGPQAVAPGAAFTEGRSRNTRAAALVLFCVGAACLALIGAASDVGHNVRSAMAISSTSELPADFMHSKNYATTSYLAASARTFSATARGIMQDAKMHLVSGRGETQLSWVPGVKEQLTSAAKAKTALPLKRLPLTPRPLRRRLQRRRRRLLRGTLERTTTRRTLTRRRTRRSSRSARRGTTCSARATARSWGSSGSRRRSPGSSGSPSP
ncbi:hypothetical protein T484DRAFT_1877546 [Baffinella frigidus]|nr:hypothetical protein T484DRAFT_1877546 [Cryptophyta sp. CCMP2293]